MSWAILSFLSIPAFSQNKIDFVFEGIKYEGQFEEETSQYIAQVCGADETLTLSCLSIPTQVNYQNTDFSVVAIGEKAFYGNPSLVEILLPNTVSFISEQAFEYCENLHHVQFPQFLKSIGTWAFHGCESLIDIQLPASLEEMGYGVFQGCIALESIDFSLTKVENLPSFTLNSCESLKSVKLPRTLKYIGDCCFGEMAFGNYILENLEIPASLESVSGSAFQGAVNLTSFTVDPDNPYFSAESGMLFNKDKTMLVCFPSATGDVALPEGITKIGDEAFAEPILYHKLKTLTLPPSIDYIGTAAFSNCLALESLTCYSVNPPEVSTSFLGTIAFMDDIGNPHYYRIYVPERSVEQYKNSGEWQVRKEYIFPIEYNSVEAMTESTEEYADVYTTAGALLKRHVNVTKLPYILGSGTYILVNTCKSSILYIP